MKQIESEALDWKKMQNLIPAVIQDYQTSQILMLGYMDPTALQQTLSTGKVTLYSRSQQRLWVKGETSGNYLQLIKIIPDCDNDSLLLLVTPIGPTCHKGNTSCFNDFNYSAISFLGQLEQTITKRYQDKPINSYTTELFNAGVQRIAQKVGEEAIETILAATRKDKKSTISETADLLYHLLVLLRACDITLSEINNELASRTNISGKKESANI